MQGVISKTILSIVVVAVLSLAQCKINTKKINRSKQALFPFMAGLYCIVSIVYICKKYADYLIDSSILVIDNALGIVIVNFALYGVYALGRVVPGVIIWIILRKFLLFKGYVSKFYIYDEENGEWLLKNEWTNVRNLLRIFVYCGVVICGIIIGLIWSSGVRDVAHIFVFPVVIQIVVVEVYSFLNGVTEREFIHDVAGEDSYSQHISNFYKIRELYEKLFPRELLASSTGSDYSSTNAVKNLLEDLSKSDDELERTVSKFFSVNTENTYDTDGISATINLLKGKSVVFFNPFYRDLGKYLILPFINTLLSAKNCLVIVGRNSVKEDVISWLTQILDEYGKIQALWRVRELDFKDSACEVGVLSFSQLYDQGILENNQHFLGNTGFVFILEASLMINTGQVGLSILGQMMEKAGEKPVYCIADHLVNGLVDTMSHLLQTEITEVAASPVPRNVHTAMAWNADGDFLRQKLFERQTKYLGNGMELAAVAIKNQVPQVYWYGETKVPIRDIKWMVGQYFPTLCRYMNLPVQQQSIYDKIHFISNIWSGCEEREQFIIAEDEFLNLFSTMRMFLSRGKEQTFVNILSENYLLRDYMRCNTQMFMSNPNAIAAVAADYAKTDRNILFELLMTMTFREVHESEVLRELQLAGVETDDASYSLAQLLEKYTNEDNSIVNIRIEKRETENSKLEEESIYSVLSEKFDEAFRKSLKCAYYVCEDEKNEQEYLDARLFGHITQTILPGQYVTYNGKYYLVKQISPQNGVVLRRAANLYDERKYYKQIRKYTISQCQQDDIIALKTIMDVEIAKISVDFDVNTLGFLEMKSNNDLRSARVVDLSRDPMVSNLSRKYKGKTILRIKLPDTTDSIRFTICMLLSELFKTIFPNEWHFIAVTCMMPDNVDGMLNYLVYGLEGSVQEEYIYIIEDSELDIGLLEAVEKNLTNFLEIITDFLCWHFEKMREPAIKDPEIVTPEFPAPDVKRRKKVKDLFTRIWKLTGRKVEEEVKIADVETVEKQSVIADEEVKVIEADNPKDDKDIDITESKENNMLPSSKTENAENPDLLVADGTDIFDNDGVEEDTEYFEQCFMEMGITPIEKTRYQNECYLKFGFNEIDGRIQINELCQYLRVRGFSNNEYTKARKRDLFEDTDLDLETVNHCDFCKLPLSGVSYEVLSDGRTRCNDCTSSAITSVEEFRKIFHQCIDMMGIFYGISYTKPISVSTVDAKKVAKGYGSVYTPSTEVAVRVIGYAQRKNGKYKLLVENGSPRLATIAVMIHELTHIWQYINWNDREIKKHYPEKYHQDLVYEGMAVWAEVQYLYLIGETSYAHKQELIYKNREDIYGKGFNMFCEKYPLIREASLIKYTPFSIFPPM